MRSYAYGVQWISVNDEPECLDVGEMEGLISVLLLADMAEYSPARVAKDVVAERRRQAKWTALSKAYLDQASREDSGCGHV